MDDSSLLGQAVMAQKTLLFSNNKNIFSLMNHISTNMDFQIPGKQQCIGLNKYKISKYSQTLKNIFSLMNYISTNMDFQIPRKQQCIGLNKYKISKYSQTLKLQLTKRYNHIRAN